MTKRPNIVFITADQQRGDCYGFRGRAIKTPHLDDLARRGTSFDALITPSPVCQPARASILTGQLPLTHGVADNGIDLDPEVAEQGFAATLEAAGYDTALIGKAHFSSCQTFERTGRPECRHSSKDFGEDWYGPYMGFGHVELTALGHWHRIRPPLQPPAGLHYDKWFFDVVAGTEYFDRWASSTRPETEAAQTWSSGLPVAFHSSTWCGNRAIEYLEDRTDNDDPFLLWVSFPDPHHPFDCPEPWSCLHDVADIDMPKEPEKDLDRRPWWHRASLEGTPTLTDPLLYKFRTQASRAPDQTEEQLRDMISNYYGMISLIDHNVGRIVAALDELGLREDTLIIYTSDHGDLLGDHGLYLKGPTPYEGLLNVGLIAQGPGVTQGARVVEPVSLVDLAATFCDFAGAELPEVAQSRSLRPLMEGAEAPREAAWSEWNVSELRCGVPLRIRTVRTRDAKLTLELESGAGEMYDLVSDPTEMNNLFDDPAHSSLRAELSELIAARPGSVRTAFNAPVGMS